MQTKTSSRHLRLAGVALLSVALPSLCTAQLTYQLTPAGYTPGNWANDAGGAVGAVTQASVGAQPQLVAGATPSGSSAVRFDGGDILSAANVLSSSLVGNTSGTLFFVMKPSIQAVSSPFQWDTGAGQRLQFAENAGNLFYVHGTFSNPTFDFINTANPAGWSDQWHVVTLVRDGTAGSIRVDGVALPDQNFNVSGLTGASGTLNIGAGPGTQDPFIGDIAEVRVYQAALSSIDIGTIEGQLTQDYLTPIPEPSEYAMMFGVLCVAGAFARRQMLRKQANSAA